MTDKEKEDSGIQVYGYRWVVLGAFMFINVTIQILWICFAPIAGPAAEHYQVSDMDIGFHFDNLRSLSAVVEPVVLNVIRRHGWAYIPESYL